MPLTAGRHVAQASSSVLGPSGPDRPRDPLVPASGGAIGYRGMVDPVLLRPLRSSTRNTLRHGPVVWRIVVYL